MTPAEQLLVNYVRAARNVEHWLAKSTEHQCPDQQLHAKGKRLFPAGSTCTICRARIKALHKLSDARQARSRAQAEQHRYVRQLEEQARHGAPAERRRVRKEQQ